MTEKRSKDSPRGEKGCSRTAWAVVRDVEGREHMSTEEMDGVGPRWAVKKAEDRDENCGQSAFPILRIVRVRITEIVEENKDDE